MMPSPAPSGRRRLAAQALSALGRAGGAWPERRRATAARARRTGQDADHGLPQGRLHLAQGRRREDDDLPAGGPHLRRLPRRPRRRSRRQPGRRHARPPAARETTANGRRRSSRDAAEIGRYADIRGYTSQAPSRLEVVAGDDDSADHDRRSASRVQSGGRAARAPLQPRLPRHSGPACSSSATRGHARRCRSGRRRERAEPRRRPRRELDARLARSRTATTDSSAAAVAVLNAVTTARASSTSTGSRGTSRPAAAPASASRGIPHLETGAEADLDQLRAQHAQAPSSSSPPRSPPASPNQPKGGHDHVRSSRISSSPPQASAASRTRTACPEARRSRRSISGLAFWALLAALAGLLISAAVWALSSHSGNYHHTSMGRRGTLISAVAAFLVGAAPAIIAFFENLGQTVK